MIDISIIARDLNLPPEAVQRTVEMLDEGNTIPFITRFRKDETGGLNEQQILSIKQRSASLRGLAERKAFVLKSIDSQGKLTDAIKVAVDKASTSGAVEDIYLPYKPRKKSRAQDARQKGLGPLADDVFNGVSPEVDLATRATEYVRVDKGLNSVDEVIRGVSDLLAERFADNADLRRELRDMIRESGKLRAQSTVQLEVQERQEKQAAAIAKKAKLEAAKAEQKEEVAAKVEGAPKVEDAEKSTDNSGSDSEVVKSEPAQPIPEVAEKENSTADVSQQSMPKADAAANANGASETTAESTETSTAETDVKPQDPPGELADSKSNADSPQAAAPTESVAAAPAESESKTQVNSDASEAPKPPAKKKKKKRKKKKAVDDPYKDYHNFKQPIKKFPNHRVLSINRGERAGKLKVKIECDDKKILAHASQKLIPAEHPFAEHLKVCLQDALSRLIIPSLEREIRRELTESAEKHAVEVFASNLRNLLLQPPIRNRRVLAIDPGYKRGCSVAVLEKNGELLHSDHVFVVGNQTRRDESKKKVADLVNEYKIDLIAIGNGAACREAEQMVSDCIATHLSENEAIRYVMVNEAGASIYSTSEVGREELPDQSPAIRSAISIGRRLQDPMSELVKIAPANIGVGMYQHDVKAKHLSESLDDVVQFCVNQVGVDVNSASPSLLRYVSGLNALTAKRLVEHRSENGRFQNRQQLKEVSGFGDATFVQAAGFLRILNGDSPLDSTSIHPESYPVANQIIGKVDATAEDLFPPDPELESQVGSSEQAEVAAKVESSAKAEPEQAKPSQPSDAAKTAEASEDVVPADSATEAATEPTSDSAAASEPTAPPETSPPEVEVTKTEESKPVSHRNAAIADARKKRREIVDRIAALDFESLEKEISAGKMLLTDIVRAMKRPDWDPREKTRKPVFRRGMIKTDDLTIGMQLDAQIVNVVDFGVFVDIGLGESCLVHVSQLSNRYIADPQVMFAVGDVIRTWVAEIEPKKRRVKLTAIKPGSQRSSRPPRSRNRKPDTSGAKPASSENRSRDRNRGRNQNQSGDRSKFRGGSKPSGDRKTRGHSSHSKTRHQKPKTPKIVKPITEEMLKGEAPMTSFSDLMQFVKKKPEDKKGDSKN